MSQLHVIYQALEPCSTDLVPAFQCQSPDGKMLYFIRMFLA